MMTDLKIFNEKRASEGKMAIDHGMGINTDSIVSVILAHPKEWIISDYVNLAARIESACKREFTY